MTPSERIDQLIADLTDWRRDTFTAMREAILEANRMIIGSPDTVIRKLREVLARVRPGILAVWTNDGSISHKDTMRCLELMGQEVLPALREIGTELELTDPFQKTP